MHSHAEIDVMVLRKHYNLQSSSRWSSEAMTIQTVSQNKSYAGVQGVYKHASRETKTDMTFSVYVPPHPEGIRLPVVWYLSGLTCIHANVTKKSEFRSACAELGLILVAPDTSPRGDGVPGDPAGRSLGTRYARHRSAGNQMQIVVKPLLKTRRSRMWRRYLLSGMAAWLAMAAPASAAPTAASAISRGVIGR